METEEPKPKVYFEESQRFRQWWIWLLLLAIFGDVIKDIVTSIRNAPSINASSVLTLLSLALLPLCIIAFIAIIKLQTQVTDEGILVRFYPIHIKYKLYRWSDIKRVYIRKYSPLSEYGGWGFRGLFGNKAYNVSGNIGMQIIFANDDRLLIGTKKQEELREALLQTHQLKFDSANSL